MPRSRRIFLQRSSLLAASFPFAGPALRAAGASMPARPVPAADPTGVLREVLFSLGNLTEQKSCYDRYEPLRKSERNPVLTATEPWAF